jgi:hypothetical protein
MHAIIVQRRSFLARFRERHRYVISVDEHWEVTMIAAEPKRS